MVHRNNLLAQLTPICNKYYFLEFLATDLISTKEFIVRFRSKIQIDFSLSNNSLYHSEGRSAITC
jgi:hypothetical protein